MASGAISVLVVEDEMLVRMAVVMSLEVEGFHAFEASDADEAIKSELRLLFTNIDMPGSMHGLKLAEAVRDRWPPIEIIVTSGHHHLSDDALGRSQVSCQALRSEYCYWDNAPDGE